MKKLRNQEPDFQKEIQIQPIIHQNLQPVITTEIQPVITRKIQPVIFEENQTNIEEIIQQLEQSHKQNNTNIIEKHMTNEEILPLTKKKTQCLVGQKKFVPYIMRVEQHVNHNIVEPKTETITENIEIVEYVPYIKNKNGDIIPYAKKGKQLVVEYIPHTYMQNKCRNNESNKNNTQMIGTIIAVNFFNQSLNINYPMACKITDIFSKIEEKLYQEFPELREKNYYFTANGKVIDRFLTFEQNKIKSGNTILINEDLLNN